MRPFAFLQDRFGFTRGEIVAVLFLVLTFFAGLGVRWAGGRTADPPSFDYSSADSIFAARSRNPAVPRERSTPRPSQRKIAAGSEPLNINAASAGELVRLPGIGNGLAGRIITYRNDHGPFRSVDEVGRVPGIGPKKLEQIRPFVTAGPL